MSETKILGCEVARGRVLPEWIDVNNHMNVAYYVLACGLGVLETNANPYVMALGSPESATRRLNFAQSFNPIGAVLGIILCQKMIMANLPQDASGQLSIKTAEEATSSLNTVIVPYLSVAVILAIVWILILVSKMPKASDCVTHTN